ncbi:MAG: hypothetical protein Q7T07_05860 [Burkholderiaceae bacterium]|nr:hypothetical protein [Burkholderiaceae bacterium]
MNVNVLGCFGAIAKNCRTRSFLRDHEVLIQELHLNAQKNRYPIYITHTKPAEIDAIKQEIEQLNHAPARIESPQSSTMQPAYFLAAPTPSPSVLVPAPRLRQLGWLLAGPGFAA